MKLIKFQLGGVQAKKLESKEATPFMNFFKFLIPGFKLAYDQKLALRNYDAKMKALYRVRIPLQETPESIYKPKVLLAKKPLTTVALNKPITKHLLGTTKGGLIERSDNTRVASGRPLVLLNRIPWGAGKGQAGQNPLVYLWNNPYVAGTVMAMAPIAMKVQSKNVYTPAQSIRSPLMSTNQTYGLLRLYRTAQLKGYKGTIKDFITLSSEILGTPQVMGSEGNKFYGYNLEKGNNVLYSRPNPENPKVEGLTVNEPARWQELLKKIIK